MNKLYVIGRLTRNPEQRTTQSGLQVCTFTVAVNRRQKEGEEPQADFFKVTAWRKLAEVCGRYLQKGYRVAVTGPVGLEQWQGQDGQNKAQMTITAEDVEILTSKAEANQERQTAVDEWNQKVNELERKEEQYRQQERKAIQNEPPKYVEVDLGDDLPF